MSSFTTFDSKTCADLDYEHEQEKKLGRRAEMVRMASVLEELIGNTITDVTVDATNSITLKMDSGAVFRLTADTKHIGNNLNLPVIDVQKEESE